VSALICTRTPEQSEHQVLDFSAGRRSNPPRNWEPVRKSENASVACLALQTRKREAMSAQREALEQKQSRIISLYAAQMLK
jgi:hypothetical protein